jgi:peptidoglycan hydrolase FlgJ
MAVRLDPNVTATPAREQPAAPVNAHDFKQFAALRRGAQTDDPAVLREAARQFESLFTKMMLEGMRSASFGDPMFGSDQADMYQDMMDDQMAVQLSSGRGIGLADMLIRQLSQGGQGAQAALGVESHGGGVNEAQRQKFVEQMRPHAEAAARELGVHPNNLIAQAALETGWGRSQPGGNSHNLFGIKAGANWNGDRVQANTEEFAGETATRIDADFRAYGSARESVEDYVRLIRDNPRYAGAVNTGSDVQAFANALQRGGYATDPDYARKLVSVAAEVGQRIAADSFKSGSQEPIPAQGPMRMSSNG